MVAQQEQDAPIRVRTRRRDDELLPLEVVAYMRENFDEGEWPESDPPALLTFIERFFSRDAYLAHRHRIVDRLLRAGYDVPRMAVLFNRTERQVQNWKREMREAVADAMTSLDVRDIHVRRMADFYSDLDALDEIVRDPSTSKSDKAQAIRTKRQVHAMMDQVLRQAGYYRLYDLNKQRPQDSEDAQNTEDFLDVLETSITGEVPLLEHEGGE